jgi:formylglycine-generating enzyme required for sulfatase activity
MKTMQFIIPFLITAIIVILTTCKETPTELQNEFIEPEMISIKEHLKFTYGPSWDTTFTPPDSLPMLVVELEPYKIGKYELTNEEYKKFVKDGGYKDSVYWSDDGWNCKVTENWSLPVYWSENKLWMDDPYSNKKNTPVHGISYYEAEAYCQWLSIKTNKNYHIPSSYQWERAAKGPDPGTKYPWGNDYNRSLANFIQMGDKVPLVEVSSFEEGKSIEGCYNMIGNAFEICLIHQAYNPSITFAGYYSIGLMSGVSSGGDPYYREMTTISFMSVQNDWRFYALGFRIVKEN